MVFYGSVLERKLLPSVEQNQSGTDCFKKPPFRGVSGEEMLLMRRVLKRRSHEETR